MIFSISAKAAFIRLSMGDWSHNRTTAEVFSRAIPLDVRFARLAGTESESQFPPPKDFFGQNGFVCNPLNPHCFPRDQISEGDLTWRIKPQKLSASIL